MSCPEWLVFAAWVAGAVFGWLGLVFFVPSNLRSLFRYRLWRLRDQMVDQVILGKLPPIPFVENYIRMIEVVIMRTSQITLLHWAWAPTSSSAVERFESDLREAERILSDDQKRLLEQSRGQFQGIIVHRLLFGSVSGWGFLAVSCPIVTVVLVYKFAKKGLTLSWGRLASAYGFFLDERNVMRKTASLESLSRGAVLASSLAA
jgi:hypothetical protein